MSTALFIGQLVLAAVFVLAGLNKFVRPDPELRRMFGSGYWAIGVVELAAAAGLALPMATGTAVVLVPLAALGLALMMIGAALVNHRIGRNRDIGVNVVLLALAAGVAVGALPGLG
jgi:uncharacterized membrane protein YphA (DoxX/SURF4 family)